MRLVFSSFVALLMAWPLAAAELHFDFSELKENQLPAGFRSAVSGEGRPGEWKILLDDVPSGMRSLTPQAPAVSKRAVLAQVSQDPKDEHFPLLIYEKETFSDFTLTTRFKTVSGKVERMAGMAFRLLNETNFYVLRASSLGNTFRFYKVVDGQRGTIIGPEVPIPSGEWHEMTIICKGNTIRCLLNGKELIPMLTDSTFTSGKVAFWTKSDSVSYFTDTRISYTPRENPAQGLVRSTMRKYPRLLGLKVYVPGSDPGTTRIVGSTDESEIGQPGSDSEHKVIADAEIYWSKDKGEAAVIMPLRDRNGDPIAAARVILDSFPGQTERNAVIRASTIVKAMQKNVQSMQDLVE